MMTMTIMTIIIMIMTKAVVKAVANISKKKKKIIIITEGTNNMKNYFPIESLNFPMKIFFNFSPKYLRIARTYHTQK